MWTLESQHGLTEVQPLHIHEPVNRHESDPISGRDDTEQRAVVSGTNGSIALNTGTQSIRHDLAHAVSDAQLPIAKMHIHSCCISPSLAHILHLSKVPCGNEQSIDVDRMTYMEYIGT